MDQYQSQDLARNQNFFRFLTFKSNILSSIITNRTIKPFIQAHDFYPGFKLEEACFSKAIVRDVDSKSKKKGKSDLDQGEDGPITWPYQKSVKQTSYENFLEEVVNTKTGEFYPQRDENGTAVKGTGATYFILAIYRVRRADGSEFLYTKGRVDAFNSLGDPVNHSISMPEVYTKVKFKHKTEFNSKTNQLEKVLQGPSSAEEIHTMPFTKEALKSLYDRRENDLLGLAVKDEPTGKAIQVRDVTGNLTKSYELIRDQSFDNLFGGNHIPQEIKAELRAAAVADGLIGGTVGDYNQPSSTANTTAKNTYQ